MQGALVQSLVGVRPHMLLTGAEKKKKQIKKNFNEKSLKWFKKKRRGSCEDSLKDDESLPSKVSLKYSLKGTCHTDYKEGEVLKN